MTSPKSLNKENENRSKFNTIADFLYEHYGIDEYDIYDTLLEIIETKDITYDEAMDFIINVNDIINDLIITEQIDYDEAMTNILMDELDI